MRHIATEYDPILGITEKFNYDDQTGQIVIERVQDVENNLDLNKKIFNEFDGVGYGDSKGMHKVATIPLIILEKWLREEGFNWFNSTDKERKDRLNAPENRFLLVRPGKL